MEHDAFARETQGKLDVKTTMTTLTFMFISLFPLAALAWLQSYPGDNQVPSLI